MGQVSRDFDLTETAVREWVRQAEREAGSRQDGLTTAERRDNILLEQVAEALGAKYVEELDI